MKTPTIAFRATPVGSFLGIAVANATPWISAHEAARNLGGFLLDEKPNGFDVYRPQPLPSDTGLYIGTIRTPDDLPALLASRCEWCAWPARTGYLRESDQRTPMCLHGTSEATQ